MTDPIELFRDWHRNASASSISSHPNAMCVSTVDKHGTPHARFVDLKAVWPEGFVFCTSHSSPKSQHLEVSPWVSLTFWWDHVGRQVRVLGSASPISGADADAFFAERTRDAQIAAWAFEQSLPYTSDGATAADLMAAARARLGEDAVPRPSNWGGYLVVPRTIEFLMFSLDRAHRRTLFERTDRNWIRTELQP